MPSWTDSRGNGAALYKLMSTKFRAFAVLMDLASYMKSHGLRTVVEWTPRDCSRELDALARGVVSDFNPDNNTDILLPRAVAAGREAERKHHDAMRSGGLSDLCPKQRCRKPKDNLSATDP